MVEYALSLDSVFQALSNEYRRDILRRVAGAEQTAGRLARAYGLTLAAVAKHFGILERAGLVMTEKRGKERFARLAPSGLRDATQWLNFYESYWNGQLDSLTRHLEAPND